VANDLKPCPFCGDNAPELKSILAISLVVCEVCGARGPSVYRKPVSGYPHKKAVKGAASKWNTRKADEDGKMHDHPIHVEER